MLLPLLCLVASAGGFEKNLGQTDAQVRYLLRSRDVSVFLTDRETVFRTSSGSSIFMESAGKPIADSVAASTITSYVGPRERWREDVPVFDRIRRRDVFPGIDIVHYGAEYDFVVAPGANPRAIAMRFRGQKSLRIDEAGSLVFDNDLQHKRPVAYQRDETGRKTSVESWFQLRGDVVTFGVGDYDSSRELVIDPEFEAVRFHGGSGDDEFLDAEMVAGTTTSVEFPLAYSAPKGGRDVFISASGRVFYFGGSGDERPTGLFPVFGGYVVAGETTSRDLPLGSLPSFRTSAGSSSPAVRGSYGGGETDGFLLSVYYGRTRPGDATISASYVGGSGRDRVVGVTESMVVLNTDSQDLLVTKDGLFQNEPATNYAFTITEPFVAGYLNGSAITTTIEAAGTVVAGAADGGLRTIRTDGKAPLRSALPGGLPVRSLKLSFAGWGLVAASDGAIARFDVETLAVEGLYGLSKSTRVRDLLLKQNYALVAGRYDGGDTPDGFLTAVDLSTGNVPVWMPAGGSGIDEVNSIREFADGTIHIVGTSTAPWAGATWRGGVDAFEATVRLPFADISTYVPERMAKDFNYPLPVPAGATVISSDPSRVRVSGSGKDTVLEAHAATGSSMVTIRDGKGSWPAAFRIRLFAPVPSFEAPFGGRMVIDGAGFLYANYPTGGILRPGVALPLFRVRLANPALGSVTPAELNFATGDRLPVTITAAPGAQGSTELILESALGTRIDSIPVDVLRPLPQLPGDEPCVTARGFSMLNRAPIAVQTGLPVTVRGAEPGQLLFAQDVNLPLLVNEVTVPGNAQFRIAATTNAPDTQALEYDLPGGSRGVVGCTAITPTSRFSENIPIFQLRDGPKRVRLGASYFDRIPLPIAYALGASVTSSNPDVLSVEMGSDWMVTLSPKALGQVTLSVAVPGALPTEVSVLVADGTPIIVRGPVAVGKDLQTRVFLGDNNKQPSALNLESSDPSKLVLSLDPDTPGTAKLLLASANVPFWVQALSDSGSVPVRITGQGFSPTVLAVQLYPSIVGISPQSLVRELFLGNEFTLKVFHLALFEALRFGLIPTIDPAVEQLPRPGLAPAKVSVTVDNPAILSIEPSGPLNAPASIRIRTLQPGDARLRISVEGFPALDRLSEIPVRVVPAP